MPTPNVFVPRRLSYLNRDKDAEDFFRNIPLVQYGDKICEFTGSRKLEYLPVNYKNNLPMVDTMEIQPRSPGNAHPSAVRGYESFFKPFSAETILEDIPSRHKTLHLGVVFGMTVDQLNKLMKELSFRPLSDSNPFELTIWGFLGLLEAKAIPNDRNNLETLQTLYQDVCATLERCRDNIGSYVSIEDKTSAQSKYLSVDLGAMHKTFLSQSTLTRESFLQHIEEISPFLRYHVKASEDAFSETIFELTTNCSGVFSEQKDLYDNLDVFEDKCDELNTFLPLLSSKNQALLTTHLQDVSSCVSDSTALIMSEANRSKFEEQITRLKDMLTQISLLENDLDPNNRLSRIDHSLTEAFANVKEILTKLPIDFADPEKLRQNVYALSAQFNAIFKTLKFLVPKDSKDSKDFKALEERVRGDQNSSLIQQLLRKRGSGNLTMEELRLLVAQFLECTKKLEEIFKDVNRDKVKADFLRVQKKYQNAVKEATKKLDKASENVDSIPKEHKKNMDERISELYDFWAPFSGMQESSFKETIRRILDGNHGKSPSRELLILTRIFYQLKTNPTDLHESKINSWLSDIGQPALTDATKFDQLIKRLLSTPVINDEQFKTLLFAYDHAHQAYEDGPLLNFQMSTQVPFSLLRLIFTHSDGSRAVDMDVIIQGNSKGENINITRKTNLAGIVTFQNIPFTSYEVSFASKRETVTLTKNKPSFTKEFTV